MQFTGTHFSSVAAARVSALGQPMLAKTQLLFCLLVLCAGCTQPIFAFVTQHYLGLVHTKCCFGKCVFLSVDYPKCEQKLINIKIWLS